MALPMRAYEPEHALERRGNTQKRTAELSAAERDYFLTPAEYDRFIEEAYKPEDYKRTVRAWPAG